MMPGGQRTPSAPAPHHDIYSIEDLRQLVYSLKEATHYEKPVIVKIAAVHNVAAIASRHCALGRGHHCHRRLPGRHGRGAHPHPGQRGHPHRACAGGCGFQRLRDGGHPRRCEPWWWAAPSAHAADVVKGRGAGSGRGIYRYQRTAGIGVPPVPDLPVGHAATGASPPRGPDLVKRLNPDLGAAAAGEPGHRLAAMRSRR